MTNRFSTHSLTSTQGGAIYKNKTDTIVFLYGLDISCAKFVIIYIILVNNGEFNIIKIKAVLNTATYLFTLKSVIICIKFNLMAILYWRN